MPFCLVYVKKTGYLLQDRPEANEPKPWMGNPEVLRMSVVEQTFWKDRFVPDGQWRMINSGEEFVHDKCFGILELKDDQDIGEPWKLRHTCSRCHKKIDFERC